MNLISHTFWAGVFGRNRFFAIDSSGFFRGMISAVVTVVILGITARAVFAATPPNTPSPDSGTVIQAAKPPEQSPKPNDATDLKIAETPANTPAGNEGKLRVNSFRFSGELPVLENELQQIAAPRVGKDLTLTDLNNLSAEITHYLRVHGFMVAMAYIPAQTIQNGQVEIAIIPGKYGVITINNQAAIATTRLEKMCAVLKTGDVVTRKSLERVLLLINDLPGVGVKGSLEPGRTGGTTDLTLNVIDTAPISGSYYADNWGNKYTGTFRGGINANFENLGHYGDTLQIGAQTTGSELRDFTLNYSLPLGYDGLRLAVDCSRVDYTLGEDFKAMDASGDATYSGFNLRYPFLRSHAASLYGIFGYDSKDLDDKKMNLMHIDTSKTDHIWELGINGNYDDAWHGMSGANNYSLETFFGRLSIDDPSNSLNDPNTAKAAGDFSKILFSFSRRQQLKNPNYSLNLNLSAQVSSKNLDSSEKFYLGGADGVRAYPQGEAASDQGVLLTLEVKRLMTQWSNATNVFYLANFYDYGAGQLNKNPWADDANDRHLADIGLGLIWVRPNFNLRLDYAYKLGSEQADSDKDSDGRFWLQAVKYF